MVKSHVECSSELVWQCVKKNNAYVRASVNRTRLSAEKGNVTAKHGFSSSGASFFVCNFFIFLVRFFPLFSLWGVLRRSSREKERARCVVGRGRTPRVDLFFFFLLSLSLSIARAGAQGHTRTPRRNKTSPPPKKKREASARFWKRRQRKKRKREKERG